MNDREIEKKLKNAVTAATPDVLDAIHADLGEQKGTVLTMKTSYAASSLRRIGAGIAAAFLLAGAGLFGYTQYTARSVASTVALDVNPSLEIRVNKKEAVLEVIPKNEDGRTVLGDMDLEGADLTLAVNALIGSMLREGYLNELANSILISVQSRDPAAGAALQTKLSDEVSALLHTDSFDGAVLSQTTAADAELQAAAEQYGITVGKASLIREITKNTQHTMEELAVLSVNDLNLLLTSSAVPSETVSATGSASDRSYVGHDAALAAAYAHAGITTGDVRDMECELDFDDGRMIYEIEFRADGYEYEYDIHAVSGEILHSEKKRGDDDDRADRETAETGRSTTSFTPDPAAGFGSLIGSEKALSAAYAHAGVLSTDAYDVDCELDADFFSFYYEIDFSAAGYEYEYRIDARTGEVLGSHRETDDGRIDSENMLFPDSGDITATPETKQPGKDWYTTPVQETAAVSGYIGREAALAAAYAHADVSSDDVRGAECELEHDGRTPHYEIEFSAGGYEYEYEINAADGTVLKSGKERD